MQWFTVLIVALLVLVAGMVPLTRSYHKAIHQARQALQGRSSVVETTHGPIEYGETGEGVCVLSIHGAGGGFDQGLHVAEDMLDDGFRIIAPSRFGYLRTPVPADHSVEAQAECHAALLKALRIDRAVVVGASAGARSAVEFAIRHPDRTTALILVVPATYAPDQIVKADDSMVGQVMLRLVTGGASFGWWLAQRLAPSALMRFIGVPPEILRTSSEPSKVRVNDMVASVQPLSERFRGIQIDSKVDAVRRRFDAIVAPTLVITARDDVFNTLPAARICGGGHTECATDRSRARWASFCGGGRRSALKRF